MAIVDMVVVAVCKSHFFIRKVKTTWLALERLAQVNANGRLSMTNHKEQIAQMM